MKEKPARGRTPLRVRVRYEPGRGSPGVMARSYERAVPIARAVVAEADAVRDVGSRRAEERASPERAEGAA